MPASPAGDPILKRFRASLDALYGDRIERVVLYGSRARGDAQVWAALRELVLRRSCAGDKARPLTGAIGAPSGSSPQCHVARGCRRSVVDRNELGASSTAWRRRYVGNPRRSTTGMLRVR